MTPLRQLIESVEAGENTAHDMLTMLTKALPEDSRGLMSLGWRAYEGSLDAALQLHEALLPGWTLRLTATVRGASFPYAHIFKMRMTADDLIQGENSSGYRGNLLARAWLLATLRAYQAQQEGEG